MANEMIKTANNNEDLFSKVSALIEQTRSYVKTSVNTAEVYTKYYIGKYIVEYEQKGNVRAQYGKQVIKDLSQKLTERFGTGWSYPSLKNIKQFYLTYAERLNTDFSIESQKANQWLANSRTYVDLVLYNRLLQCYVLIDLKIDKLTHQDLGQMQMYVNYFDRYIKQDFEKPTIGILLCKEKNDALVELTLPKDANIYASAYQLYLPDKNLLQAKVKEWIAEFEENNIN